MPLQAAPGLLWLWQIVPFQTLAVFLGLFLLISDVMKRRRPRNFPPGPLILPFLGNLLHMDVKRPLIAIEKLAEKYGNIFSTQMGSMTLVFVNGFQLVKEVLVHQGDDFLDRPQIPAIHEFYKTFGSASSTPKETLPPAHTRLDCGAGAPRGGLLLLRPQWTSLPRTASRYGGVPGRIPEALKGLAEDPPPRVNKKEQPVISEPSAAAEEGAPQSDPCRTTCTKEESLQDLETETGTAAGHPAPAAPGALTAGSPAADWPLWIIEVWGEASNVHDLCTSHRNAAVYGCMVASLAARGHQRSREQVRCKIKDLRQSYSRACLPGADPEACPHFQALDRILGAHAVPAPWEVIDPGAEGPLPDTEEEEEGSESQEPAGSLPRTQDTRGTPQSRSPVSSEAGEASTSAAPGTAGRTTPPAAATRTRASRRARNQEDYQRWHLRFPEHQLCIQDHWVQEDLRLCRRSLEALEE